jgi:hypothetical protein
MRTRIFACTLTLLVAVLLVAQQSPKKSGEQNSKAATVEGCLTGPNEQNVYVLANEKRCCILLEGEPDLSAHVGHRVKLTGEWAEGPEELRGRENIAGKKVREGKKVKDEPEPQERFFKVARLEHLADTCTLPEAKD